MSQRANSTPNQSQVPDYKGKLDEAATRVKSPPSENHSTGLIGKVAQYVPVSVGKMLGASQEKQQESSPAPTGKDIPGPPDRPTHDTQIEEFIKDQHHSKDVIGVDEPSNA